MAKAKTITMKKRAAVERISAFSIEQLTVKMTGTNVPQANLVHFQARATAGLLTPKGEIMPRQTWPEGGQVIGHGLIIGHWPLAGYDFYWRDDAGNELRAHFVDRITYELTFTFKDDLDWTKHPFVAFFGEDGWSVAA